MLYQITYLLFKGKLIQPSERAIHYWMQTAQIEKLEYALKYGNYKTRKLAAEALEYAGNSSSIPVLLQATTDKVQNVSLAALNALENLCESDELLRSIIKKRFNWVLENQERAAKYEANKNKKYKIYRWERSSKKSFDRVKEQLKKPIR